MGTSGTKAAPVWFWRIAITVVVSSNLYITTTFMTKESFKTWETGHDTLRNNILKNIDDRFATIQNSLNRIETKVERIQAPRRAEVIQPLDTINGLRQYQLMMTNRYE